jgi:CubicO group peptidase (beta-lactamase class C family)
MSEIASAFQDFVDRELVAGVVLLTASSEKVLSLEAVGFADVYEERAMRTDEIFWIASTTKPITATGLMMLVDEGRVSVDDPVEKYLPEFRGQMVVVEKDDEHVLLRKPANVLRVRHVLSHTGGLAFASPLEAPTLDRMALADTVLSHAMLPLLFEPGSRYQYSNGGTNTAGRIIEVVAGMPYETFMQERLFDPLGMRDTTFWPEGEQLGRLAKSYEKKSGEPGLREKKIHFLGYPLDDRRRHPVPGGGLFSTASDLAVFAQMILRGGVHQGRRMISAEAVEQMTRRETGGSIAESYGFCWWSEGEWFGHGGAYKNDLNIRPRADLITIFMVQLDGDWPDEGLKDTVTRFMKSGQG